MKLNQGMIPPGGFHFQVANGVILKSPTYTALIKDIMDWRTQNGEPIGSPEKDVDRYFCKTWPHFCVPETHERSGDGRSSMLKLVNGWTARTLRDQPFGGYDLVDQKTSESRCVTCISCPFNKPWRSDCGACMKSTDAISARIRQLRKIALDDGLVGCSINGFDNKTAVHMLVADLRLTDDQLSRLPQNCWIQNSTE
jgi:hypothetical protein